MRLEDINQGRFALHMTIGSPDDCWPWTGARFDSGYGVFTVKRQARRAHRVAFLISRGDIPDGMNVLHRCDNPICCNPHHLFLGTDLDNVADRDSKGRQTKGVDTNTTKLTEEQVVAIRKDTRGQRAIAKDYGICKSTVGYIKRGENWRHLQ